MLRKIVASFLRSTAKGPLAESLPEEQPTGVDRVLRALGFTALFGWIGRQVGKVLSPRAKARIQDSLINRFRVPVRFQDTSGLEQSFAAALDRLKESVGPEAVGDYLEFGVYQGNSLLCMHRASDASGVERMRLFGFDSFAGLPESADEEGVWSAGQYRSELEFTRQRLEDEGIDWSRTVLVKGFFGDSLTPDLVDRHEMRKASVIMIDCDLYSSAIEALRFCGPLIVDEAWLFFDDWNSTDETAGEKRAFGEFLAEIPELTADEIGAYSDNSAVFLVRRVRE